MAWTYTWDATTPAATDSISEGDDKIREFKNAVAERCGDIYGFNTGETDDTKVGSILTRYHVQSADPTAVANKLLVYGKDNNAETQLYAIDEGSVVHQLTSQVKIRATLSGDQTIGTGSITKVTWDTETYDVGSNFASNKFTVPTGGDGYFLIVANVTYVKIINEKKYDAYIYKNGVATEVTGLAQAPNTDPTGRLSLSVCGVIKLVATDYIEVFSYHTSGINNDIDATYSFLNIHQIS